MIEETECIYECKWCGNTFEATLKERTTSEGEKGRENGTNNIKCQKCGNYVRPKKDIKRIINKRKEEEAR